MKFSKTGGFTLIELVVVITIIGILAAVALPRFVNVQKEARVAKLNAARGAVRSATLLVHSVVLTKNGAADVAVCPGTTVIANNTTTVCTESGVVAVSNGYPASTAVPSPSSAGIVGATGLTANLNPTAAELLAEGYIVTVTGTTTTFQVQGAQDALNCKFDYTEGSAGAAPTISTALISGC